VPPVFGDIRELLEQQFNRLSRTRKEIMYWLAINRELVSFPNYVRDIVQRSTPTKITRSFRITPTTISNREKLRLHSEILLDFTLQ